MSMAWGADGPPLTSLSSSPHPQLPKDELLNTSTHSENITNTNINSTNTQTQQQPSATQHTTSTSSSLSLSSSSPSSPTTTSSLTSRVLESSSSSSTGGKVEAARQIFSLSNKQQLHWHLDHPNQGLVEKLSLFSPPSSSPSPVVFVPLCGKTVDLVYLATLGYRVIGVEYVDTAVLTFFTENQQVLQGYNKQQKDTQCIAYTAKALPLTLYCCDIFHPALLSFIQADHHGSSVNHIWDRGAFVAINRPHRARYLHALFSLLDTQDFLPTNPDERTHMLLSVIAYPPKQQQGPPHSVLDGELRQLVREAQTTAHTSGSTEPAAATQSAVSLEAVEPGTHLYIQRPQHSLAEVAAVNAVVAGGTSLEGRFRVTLLSQAVRNTVAMFGAAQPSITYERMYGITRLSTKQ